MEEAQTFVKMAAILRYDVRYCNVWTGGESGNNQ